MDVSVILPVRDAAPTIDSALASVLASRDASLEVICVDDGSRDASRQRLEAWGRRDARLRVIATPARGICAALATALEHARAPLVARMDADDEVHPERLAAQLRHLEAQPRTTLLGCRVDSFRDAAPLPAGWARYTAWVNELVDAEAHRRSAFIDCPLPHPTWMFRREKIQQLGGYREAAWPEDLDLLYRVLAAGGRVEKLPRRLHRWRDRPDRLSRVDPRYDRAALMRVKAHYLGRVHPMAGAVIWGAGKSGRRLARGLGEEGVAVKAMLDVAPRRIGRSWRGIPILAPAAVSLQAASWKANKLRILGAVARLGARDEIRQHLQRENLMEGADFVMMV